MSKVWSGVFHCIICTNLIINKKGIREKAKFLKVRGLYTCWSNIEYTIQGLGHINHHNKIGAKPGSGRHCFSVNLTLTKFTKGIPTQPLHMKNKQHLICYLAGLNHADERNEWIKWKAPHIETFPFHYNVTSSLKPISLLIPCYQYVEPFITHHFIYSFLLIVYYIL